MTRRTTATHNEAQDARKMKTKRETKTERSKWELRNNPLVLASSPLTLLPVRVPITVLPIVPIFRFPEFPSCIAHYTNGVFTLDVKSVLNENLGGILGGTQC
jgi:hypothetical protein